MRLHYLADDEGIITSKWHEKHLSPLLQDI